MTELEIAALLAIFSETPELASALQRQLERATVTSRENTGRGFYTDFAVPDDAPRVECPRVLGYTTNARVEGLEHGLGFALIMENGKLHLLDGHAWGDDTSSLDLHNLSFEIFHRPMQRPTNVRFRPKADIHFRGSSTPFTLTETTRKPARWSLKMVPPMHL